MVLGKVSGYEVVLEGEVVIIANTLSQVKLTFEDIGVINGLIARAVKESE